MADVAVAVGTGALAMAAFWGLWNARGERRAAQRGQAAAWRIADLRQRQEWLIALAEAVGGEHAAAADRSDARIHSLLAALPSGVAVVVRRRFDPPGSSDLSRVNRRVRETHHLLHEDQRADEYASDNSTLRNLQEQADVRQALTETAVAIERLGSDRE